MQINTTGKEKVTHQKKKIGKFEKNNLTFALNVLYARKEKIYPAYLSKHNSYCEKQVILLMIRYGEGWHYIVVKNLSALFRGLLITSKHHGDVYFLNCLHSFTTEKCLLRTLKY